MNGASRHSRNPKVYANKKEHILRIKKIHLHFLERIMRKKVLENFNHTGLIDDNGDMGRQRTNQPNGL